MTTQSLALAELIALRGKDEAAPILVGADDQGNEGYRFDDGTRVVVTNAGIVTEDEDGFAEVWSGIVHD